MDSLRVLNPFIAAENFRTGCRNNVILPTLKETYSQHAEDLIIDGILHILRCVKGEHEILQYVDIGANHPIEISNTYLFYRKHGHGVLFEADPDRLEELNRVRPRDKVIHAAISNQRRPIGTETLHIGNASECSTLAPETMKAGAHIPGLDFVGRIEVPALHVMDAFEQHWPQGPVQLLSIDIEGVDLPVMEAIDWNKYRPWIVCAETSPREVTQPMIDLMRKNGYMPWAMTADNFIFVDV